MPRRRYWTMLPPSRSAAKYAQAARDAEARGLEGVFSIQLGSNPWVPLGAVAATTSRIRLATGIALAFTRSPLETALAALDLDQLSEGRFTLGLGTGVGWMHDEQFGSTYARPVARMAEIVRIVKLVIGGDARRAGRFGGEFFQLDFSRLALAKPLRPNLPLWVAALRDPLVRVAGAHADGLIGHPSWSLPWAESRVRGPFAEALRASGRAREAVEVNLWQVVAPNPDARESVRDAKAHVAIYASIAQYESYFAAHGFGEQARALAAGAAAGRRDLVELVSDEMARSFVVCGTPGEVAQQLEPLHEIADSLCLQPPPVAGDARRAYEARIAETFYA
ncbi:MAG TPA: LLM class flavin-dependent oxidoreductase [Myxococcota bacterium]|jgi:alkanesulfonate monooxygenase SsuD/methylene tetrahydromethanopterin reductase-like flavin-dependent oxidoreductase (luciferase family)